MHARAGDRIVIKGHRAGQVERDCEVLEVHSKDGEPPYLVRWGDTGHEGLFFPGSDALVVSEKDAAVRRATTPRVRAKTPSKGSPATAATTTTEARKTAFR